ncbi:class I SAM-dependent rRNA methyltransferase [Aliamphritea hakodatensis]|uniref:class I SAM-dependent rRNA methyltransferase n=1 Tax=Aliamphritea hakodatensis TaxID=2895352 RepID=UPI0022FD87A1|nr:class I SAM-dependent methyltransferase [Aliamphritea hakodatensis]
MSDLFQAALQRREALLADLHAEATRCYRLYHGTTEGIPGLTLDRYGDQLLLQSFHTPLSESEADALFTQAEVFLQHAGVENLQRVYNDRSSSNSRRSDDHVVDRQQLTGQELGVNYLVKGKHKGQDPLLFLDMRAGRRWLQANAAGKSVLNLFSYTCGVGVVAAKAGASRVLNVDFATRSLDVGRENARLNDLDESRIGFFQSDFFTAAKQLAGIEIKQRVKRGQKPRQFPRIEAEEFDLVYLDPPRWAKSHFGTVDLIRDYPSVLKPSLLAVSDGGQLVCTNNVAKVSLEDWLDVVKRCASKAGRPVKDIQLITPEADFPSTDGCHPLKIAVLQL